MSAAVQLLIGTRKGAWIYRSDAQRQTWSVQGPIFLGHIVNHLVLDPRDGKTLLMAASTGHLGPTIFRSTDGGVTWAEAQQPPAFPKATTNGAAPARAVIARTGPHEQESVVLQPELEALVPPGTA